jgi:flagellar L-ring protein FlgH
MLAACAAARTSAAQAPPASIAAPPNDAPSSSLMVTTPVEVPADLPNNESPNALRSVSLFAVAPPKPRAFQQHDLVQIIVRETSQAKSSQDLQTKKDYKLDVKVPQWPNFNLQDLLNLRLNAGDNSNNPAAQLDAKNNFKGQGDYERKDDLTARLTAEVIEVLPNGNLVLEARTQIKTDDEEQSMKATGICRPADITAANTILSNQIHDLKIQKLHKGELRKANEKGILAKAVDLIFAF